MSKVKPIAIFYALLSGTCLAMVPFGIYHGQLCTVFTWTFSAFLFGWIAMNKREVSR